jgi:hypothetical protein
MLLSPQCAVPMITAFFLSLPNLGSLFLIGVAPKKPPSTLPHAPQRRPLTALRPHAVESGVGTVLAQCGLTSCKIFSIVSEAGLERLLTLSSEVIIELELSGVALGGSREAEARLTSLVDQYPSQPRTLQANGSPPAVPLPPLPTLTTAHIDRRLGGPLPHLAYILSSIRSVSVLASVIFTPKKGWCGECFPPSDPWADVDTWRGWFCRLRSRKI